MSNKALVLSIPHSGTHFTVRTIIDVFGLDCRFQHFRPTSLDLVTKTLRNLDPSVPVIIPERKLTNVARSFEERRIAASELETCYDIRNYMLDTYPRDNYIQFEVDIQSYMSRVAQLKHMTTVLGRPIWGKYKLEDWARIWPYTNKSNFPQMHEYALKETDFVDEGEFEMQCDIPPAPEVRREFTVNQWIDYCHGEAKESGWWTYSQLAEQDPIVFASKIALIHAEASEMLEGLRKGNKDEHIVSRSAEEVEAADVLIRLLDYCGARNIDLLNAAIEKMDYNKQRTDHKPEARAAIGGKKF